MLKSFDKQFFFGLIKYRIETEMENGVCCLCHKIIDTINRWPQPLAMPDGRIGHEQCVLDWLILELRQIRNAMQQLMNSYPAQAA